MQRTGINSPVTTIPAGSNGGCDLDAGRRKQRDGVRGRVCAYPAEQTQWRHPRRVAVRVVAADRERQYAQAQPFGLDQCERARRGFDAVRLAHRPAASLASSSLCGMPSASRDRAGLRLRQVDADRLRATAELGPVAGLAAQDAQHVAATQVQHIAPLIGDRRPARKHDHSRAGQRRVRDPALRDDVPAGDRQVRHSRQRRVPATRTPRGLSRGMPPPHRGPVWWPGWRQLLQECSQRLATEARKRSKPTSHAHRGGDQQPHSGPAQPTRARPVCPESCPPIKQRPAQTRRHGHGNIAGPPRSHTLASDPGNPSHVKIRHDPEPRPAFRDRRGASNTASQRRQRLR